MKMSTKARYGLRFMIDLGTNSVQGKVTLHQVAGREAISEKYLWQIANRLKAAGLINSISGAKGGYMLAKTPAKITLADILEALEGNFLLAPCIRTLSVCPRSDSCVSREVWKEINAKMTDAMKSITLGDIMDKHSKMKKNASLTYSI